MQVSPGQGVEREGLGERAYSILLVRDAAPLVFSSLPGIWEIRGETMGGTERSATPL